MIRLIAFLLTLLPLAAAAETLCFTNGRWFDGRTFRARTLCAADGVFIASRPRDARTIDLGGAFVVPPFAEAHNHNVEQSARLADTIRGYLAAGVFYVKNPNSLPRTTPRAAVNRPDSIDAIFAMGGFTGREGHPAGVMKRNIDRGSATVADADGAFYFEVDSLADLDRKWPVLMEARPDFVKTYLVYSEEYARRKDDPAKFAWKGLNPALLPEIVRRAHSAGLRVSTHVETAADFHVAVDAGVDEINHLPGFRAENDDLALYTSGRFRIARRDARRAARRGIVVVTTSGDAVAKGGVIRETIAENLQLLRKHGVKLAIGSDDYRNGVVPEVMALRDLGIFTNAELLDLWGRRTAETIFPNRRLGRLRAGYEASFLVLEGDPLRDFTNVTRIRMRVKQGTVLSGHEREAFGLRQQSCRFLRGGAAAASESGGWRHRTPKPALAHRFAFCLDAGDELLRFWQ